MRPPICCMCDKRLTDVDDGGLIYFKKRPSDIAWIKKMEEEEEEFEIEEEPRFPDYKYLNLEINKGLGENDYEISIEGQSHGFCNILVKHLLEIEGVNIAAYKVNNVELPKIFIRLENLKDLKNLDLSSKTTINRHNDNITKNPINIIGIRHQIFKSPHIK